MIRLLEDAEAEFGPDCAVYGGTNYQDYPVTGFTTVDGYPLVLVSEEVTF